MHDRLWTETADVAGDARTDAVLNGVAVSTRVIHAGGGEVGGDWCEAFVVADNLIALSVGDVCGHGTASYEAMLVARLSIRAAALAGYDPARTLESANRMLFEWQPHTYATAIFGLLDTRRRTLIFANAGHPPPFVVSRREAAYVAFASADVPLGLRFEAAPRLRRMMLPAETLIVFYTDGVTEHRREPLSGEVELAAAATVAFDRPGASTASVIERQIGMRAPSFDDAAILTARLGRPD